MNQSKSNVLSIFALIFGIIGLVLSCILIGFVPSVIGLILGIAALAKKQSKGLSIAGLVCGTMGIFFSLCMLLYYIGTSEETPTTDDSTNVVVNGSEYTPPESGDNNSETESIWAGSFTPINDFRYTLDKDAKTITLIRYEGNDTKILLSPIYSIGDTDYNLISMGDDACFLSETHITSVYIPEGVTYIGASCFNSCASLRYIYLPATIESIPSSFWGYIGEYVVYCNSTSTLPDTRDMNEYDEKTGSTSDAEDLGENFGRAFNGLLSGLSGEVSDQTVEIYFGGSAQQWTELIGNTE